MHKTNKSLRHRVYFWLALSAASAMGTTLGAAATPRWQGQLFVTKATPACAAAGSDVVGDFETMIYRPIINTGDPAESVSVISPHSASLYTSTSAGGHLNGANNFLGQRIDSAAAYSTFRSTSNFSITPSVVTATTGVIRINGTINTWFNHPGCSITFEVEMLQPPQ